MNVAKVIVDRAASKTKQTKLKTNSKNARNSFARALYNSLQNKRDDLGDHMKQSANYINHAELLIGIKLRLKNLLGGDSRSHST